MNEMTMNDSTMIDATVLGAGAGKFNPAALPEIAYFRVQSRGAVGSYKNGLAARKVGAWALLVSCKDGKGLRLASDVLFEKGMKGKCEFATYAEAVEAGKKAKAAWGKAKSEKAEKAEKKQKTVAEMVAEMNDDERNNLMAMLLAAMKPAAAAAVS